uniref:Bm647, isoform b n=1 Tax=Brugia malayi TaxID=6279 RepID=A0A1I9G490_BRUMA|nr:Bm647, isoform b [Brugia malayi]
MCVCVCVYVCMFLSLIYLELFYLPFHTLFSASVPEISSNPWELTSNKKQTEAFLGYKDDNKKHTDSYNKMNRKAAMSCKYATQRDSVTANTVTAPVLRQRATVFVVLHLLAQCHFVVNVALQCKRFSVTQCSWHFGRTNIYAGKRSRGFKVHCTGSIFNALASVALRKVRGQKNSENASAVLMGRKWDSNPRLRRDWCLKPAP